MTVLSSVLFLTACGDNKSSKSTISDKFQPIYNDFYDDITIKSQLTYINMDCQKEKGE